MKYKKCPRCQLNYICQDKEMCKVCQDEIMGIQSIFDQMGDNLVCPYCGKNAMDLDEVMCKACFAKRKRKMQSNNVDT
ncbi:MAG: hypothetical protein IJD18_04920 [Clostridia bacterium]|nr:hypothetical protein [Clostridia bacterium]MBQ3067355.1 hypothetical protein [Clostridia bacterium]MBR2966642.1 hypothetical protein [Clostridia bacterium]